MPSKRLSDLERFYTWLTLLQQGPAGTKALRDCNGRNNWPTRGVYFFTEAGEYRSDTGNGLRIVRVGTHALSARSRTTLWRRLSQHRGLMKSGGGNHRGSIFRLIVGNALIRKHGYDFPTWGKLSSAPREIREGETELEVRVSRILGAMRIICLAVPDQPGPNSLRGLIERNAIALLSNYEKPALDAPSPGWLGHHCDRERVRLSGLWNSNHVDESYDPAFLDALEQLVRNESAAP